jgi:hypothetical protein
MMHRRGARSAARVVIVVTVVLALAMLGSAADAASSAKRPQGHWTIVNWEVARDPADPQYVPGTAGVLEVRYAPRCGSGPCTVRVRPAGRNGTFMAAGEPVTRDSDRGGFVMAWNPADREYTVHRDLGAVLCTTGDGAGGTRTVPKGYRQTIDGSYRFRAARGRTAAALFGERVATATGTPASVAQGCTDFRVNGRSAGAPTGSVTVTAARAAGRYRITEIVDRTEGSGQRPHGFAGILVPESTVTAKGRGLTITGIVGPATLRSTRAGWTGSVKRTQASCVATSTSPGYETTETWTGIHPVARTEAGAPVLAGTWRYVATPKASGVHDGCSPVVNRGYVILVPMGAITP